MHITIYDATLREGAQNVGASFSLEDKLRITEILDNLGVHYIEAGNPSSNPKDEEFFEIAKDIRLKNAKLAAFGATCRAGGRACDDYGMQALRRAGTPAVCIFGKAWDFHATNILGISLDENLDIIYKSVRYMKECGKEVIFDAEHFFDGYKSNPKYAMQALSAAKAAGADWLTACDTNGGCFTHEVNKLAPLLVNEFGDKTGIHAHNDTGNADANTVAAILNGMTMAQVTLCGWGERCGNANLFVTLPNLQMKLGFDCVPPENLKSLSATFMEVCEIANARPVRNMPYVGKNAFAHKAGMHVDAVTKDPESLEHIPPESVGQERQFLLSEISGRAAVMSKVSGILPGISKDSKRVANILQEIKTKEHEGFQFEGAEASFELLVRRMNKMHEPFFTLSGFKISIIEPQVENEAAVATVQVEVNGRREERSAYGSGPVNALDKAARDALYVFYPALRNMALTDFKVRVLDSKSGTSAKVRVVIESTDGKKSWKTLGVSKDIIEASWNALVDSYEYKLLYDTIP